MRWEQRKSRRMADIPEESLRKDVAFALFFLGVAYVAMIALFVSHP